MKKVLKLTASLLILLLLVQSMAFTAYGALFRDIGQKDWFYTAVRFAFDADYMQGVGGGYFEPTEKVDRAMLATVLYRMSGADYKANVAPFKDVRLGKWYTNGVAWCAQNNIVTGYGGGYFGPFDAITRQDMVTMFFRFARATDFVEGRIGNNLKSYTDGKKVEKYARTAFNWALEKGVIDGVSFTHLDPHSGAGRAQLAQILMNFTERVLGQDVSYWRKSEQNPEGIAYSGLRFVEDRLRLRVGGLQKGGKYQLSIRIVAAGKTVGNESVQFTASARDYLFEKEVFSIANSESFTLGAYPKVSLRITLFKYNKAVYVDTLSLGKIVQRNFSKEPLYFKGAKGMDSRILLYHHFTDSQPRPSEYGTSTTPERFEDDILYMMREGYTIISLRDLLDFDKGTRALPQKTVVLTFDDGYQSNYTYIYPIIKEYNIPITIFVVVNTMEDGAGYKMSWAQMREMEKSGLVDIQSHSLYHEDHSTLSATVQRSYIRDAYAILDDQLGTENTRMLAYPFGKYNAESQRIAASHNTKVQCTTRWAALDVNHLDFTALPRITVSHNSDIKKLLAVSK